MQQWQPYGAVHQEDESFVSGDIRVLPEVAGPGVDARDILVYLPPSYTEQLDRRYPVLYMHDGQNVFDAATSFAGEWGADEAAERLAADGLETIIVAIPNGGRTRAEEYSPWKIERSRGGQQRADAYLDYLLSTVKPSVDASFRTSLALEHTGIAGSSLGGLIALYGCLTNPGVFGFCAALSPAFWPGREAIVDYAKRNRDPGLRVYLDAGRREAGPAFISSVRRVYDLLQSQGYDVAYVEDHSGRHDEASWQARFPAVLEWFLDPARRPSEAHLDRDDDRHLRHG